MICIPGRREDGSDSTWFLTDGKVQMRVGTGAKPPVKSKEKWADLAKQVKLASKTRRR
jgi:hypothetical protein